MPTVRVGPSPSARHWHGVTLVELLVAVAIGAILLSLAIPSFTTLLMNNRATAQTNALLNGLNFARSTALSKNVNVQLCPIGALSSATCGSNWATGWIVATQPVTGASTLLQSYQAGTREAKLSTVVIAGVAATAVQFDPRGLATTPANFKFCDGRGASAARSLQVQATGFAQSGPTQGQAIWGGALTCP
ncbi:MAG: GspH/FimT family pseudopilin [Herminiimonas sp.]|nr:GspH/FimT family pseudopilin [Herminiimonas sp.]